MPASQRLPAISSSTPSGGTVLFSAAGTPWTVEDAVAAGMFRGDLERAIQETLSVAGAEELAGQENYEPDSEEIQTFSDRFRYERDLISAGDTEAWIEARGLTTSEFTEWMAGQIYLRNLPARSASEPEDFPRRLHTHLWMSGLMDELDIGLQNRVAADLEVFEKDESISTGPSTNAFFARHQLDERSLSSWLTNLNRDQVWLDETLRREAAFARVCDRATSREARARLLDSMGLSLERIGLDTLELDSAAAAREAYLCVREDKVSLSEVARESGFRTEQSQIWLDTIDPGLGQKLLCAELGEALEPIEVDGGFKVFQIVQKFEPSIDDPAVASRLDKLIIDQAFTALRARFIQPSDAFRTLR